LTIAVEVEQGARDRRGDKGVFLMSAGSSLGCASLQVPGMGFAVPPDMAATTPGEEWDCASLSQAE